MSTINLHGSDFVPHGPKFCPTQRPNRCRRISLCVVRASSASPKTSKKTHRHLSLAERGVNHTDQADVARSCRHTMSSSHQMHSEVNPEREDASKHLHMPSGPEVPIKRSTELQFDKLQQVDQPHETMLRRVFGHFVAREAILNEEYWTAAWLRAENQYEGQSSVRYVDSYKRKFAEQEYNDLKRRCTGQLTTKCTCVVAVKEETGGKRTILNSIVGTLDISVRHLHHGESFPGENAKRPGIQHVYRRDTDKYAYVANVCVAKFARRRGIASNMLYLAIEAAKTSGVRQVFIHVHRNNKAAQQLYEKIGFKIVETATPHLLAEQQYLLCFDTENITNS